jgi:hypothetical protein
MHEIRLRVFGFVRGGNTYLVCLETYQVVRGKDLSEAKQKMIDALTVYLKSFSTEEIHSGHYLRPAPIRYRAMWALMSVVGMMFQAWALLLSFIYDPQSERLKLA